MLARWLARRRLRGAPDAVQQRLARLRRVPSFSVVTTDRRTTRGLVYPAFDVVASLDRASGEYVVFLSPGDLPEPTALLTAAEHVVAGSGEHSGTPNEVDLVYSDEVTADGRTFHKPDWSFELLLAQPYVLRFAAYRRAAVEAAELADASLSAGGTHEWDLALRVGQVARKVVHVPEILCRTGTSHAPTAADVDVVTAAAQRRGLRATVSRCSHAPVLSLSLTPRQPLPVTVIVPTRDRIELLRPCVDSVLQRTTYPDLSLLVVDNGSVQPETLQQLQRWQADPRVRVLTDPAPFHYAAMMNRAVAAATTPLVLLLNNDTEVISPRWLEEMVGWIERSDVGAVGAKLYYENGTVQHAGVVLGIGGVATHGHKGAPRDAAGYHGLLHSVRDVSAVTGACLLTRRDVFLQLGGFDEELRIAYNDVDYCLRLRENGWRVLFTPMAELYHREGGSRGDDRRGERRFDAEIRRMQERWGALLSADPFYNRNLSLTATDYRTR